MALSREVWLKELAAALPEAQKLNLECFWHYQVLLGKWNRIGNLVADANPDIVLRRHILDSLSILPYLRGQRCLDAGSGAGFPGLALALAEPERHWVLLDSRAKKVRFLRQAVLELNLDNVEVVCQRAEKFTPVDGFATLACRAFAPLDKLPGLLGHLLGEDSRLLVMSGGDRPELDALSRFGWRIEELRPSTDGIGRLLGMTLNP
ncbi:MAG: 16S rRNA (guanine(527)-N(7))-methyltransferase RsmG [Candidatus Eutrophobiaceae bacterium]